MFKVRARVWNPTASSREVAVEFAVDAGATYSVIPADVLEKLGIVPFRKVRLRLADNRVLEKPLGLAPDPLEKS